MIERLQLGLQLTVFGMGLVFLLLALLWGGMALMLRLDRPPARTETATPSEPIAVASGPDPDTLAAIAIAVFMHRQVRRKQAAPLMRSHFPGTLPSRWVMAGRTRQNQNWQPNRK